MHQFIYSFFLFVSVLLPGVSTAQEGSGLKNGDLIFIVTPSGQGKAIQLATHSKFTHVGIVFIENGAPMVYHAVEPVSKSTLKDFLAMSSDGVYEVRRLKDQRLLSETIVSSMLSDARKQLGKHYDIWFGWDDDRLYCSEFTWKLYKHALNIDVGPLKPLKSFDLENPLVKATLAKRYGDNVPLNEKMISPGDMYESVLLEPVGK